jgi:hypothetical protein
MTSEAASVCIKELFNAAAPTGNPVTDTFGVFRHWGNDGGWTPSAEYSPVHTGVDYSSKPESKILMPVDGFVWGEKIAGMVGSFCLMRPEHSDQYLFTFFHCEPTGSLWKHYKKGDEITTQAGYGIGAPHLHEELALTHSLGSHLRHRGILRGINWRDVVEKRCDELGFGKSEVLVRIRSMMASRGIVDIGENYIVLNGLPDYRKSKHSKVGTGLTYLVDPRIVR